MDFTPNKVKGLTLNPTNMICRNVDAKAKLVKNVFRHAEGETVLVAAADTQKCEAIVTVSKASALPQSFPDKEQTIYVVSGRGMATVGDESCEVQPRDVVFGPADTSFSIRPREGKLATVALNTFV